MNELLQYISELERQVRNDNDAIDACRRLGLYGSAAVIRAHLNCTDKCIAYFNQSAGFIQQMRHRQLS